MQDKAFYPPALVGGKGLRTRGSGAASTGRRPDRPSSRCFSIGIAGAIQGGNTWKHVECTAARILRPTSQRRQTQRPGPIKHACKRTGRDHRTVGCAGADAGPTEPIHNLRDDLVDTKYLFPEKPYVVARSESEVRRIVGIASNRPS